MSFHRFAMTALCCGDDAALVPEPVELLRQGQSFTIDTLDELEARGEGPVALLMGADMLADFPSWHEPRRILVVGRAERAPERSLPWYLFHATFETLYDDYYGNPASWASLGYAGPPQPRGFFGHSQPPKGLK